VVHGKLGAVNPMRRGTKAAAQRLDPQPVGLGVLDVHAALPDVEFVEALAVLAGAPPPVGGGALVEAVGGDHGLARAAVSEQGQDGGNQVERLVPAVGGGVARGGEGLAAGGAAAAAPLAGWARMLPRAAFPLCEPEKFGQNWGDGPNGCSSGMMDWRSSFRRPGVPVALRLVSPDHGCLWCYRHEPGEGVRVPVGRPVGTLLERLGSPTCQLVCLGVRAPTLPDTPMNSRRERDPSGSGWPSWDQAPLSRRAGEGTFASALDAVVEAEGIGVKGSGLPLRLGARRSNGGTPYRAGAPGPFLV
jgi:hypothetical protein